MCLYKILPLFQEKVFLLSVASFNYNTITKDTGIQENADVHRGTYITVRKMDQVKNEDLCRDTYFGSKDK